MRSSGRVPAGIAALFVMNLLVVSAPAIDYLLGSPFSIVRHILDLDSEHSGPAWYSSILWFCAGVQFGFLAICAFSDGVMARFVSVATFAAVCIVFSAEEIIGIHEWLGRQSDALLPGGDRSNIALSRTGVWPLLIGIPVVILMIFMIRSMRRAFAAAPRAFVLLVIGITIMFTGALAVELTANLLDAPKQLSGSVLLQVIAEEFLEMTGTTFIIWSAYELLRGYGYRLVQPSLVGKSVPSRPGSEANVGSPTVSM